VKGRMQVDVQRAQGFQPGDETVLCSLFCNLGQQCLYKVALV